MRLRPELVLSLGLVVGTILPSGAQLPPRQPLETAYCTAPTGTATSNQLAGQAIVATVRRVDLRLGEVEFTAATGTFLLTMPPAEMDNLQVGDQLLICLHEDMEEGQARVAEESPRATSTAP